MIERDPLNLWMSITMLATSGGAVLLAAASVPVSFFSSFSSFCLVFLVSTLIAPAETLRTKYLGGEADHQVDGGGQDAGAKNKRQQTVS